MTLVSVTFMLPESGAGVGRLRNRLGIVHMTKSELIEDLAREQGHGAGRNKKAGHHTAPKTDRIQLETKINALRRVGRQNVSYTTFAEVLQDPTVQSLVQERNQLEVDLNEKLRELKEGHPQIKDLRSSITTVE